MDTPNRAAVNEYLASATRQALLFLAGCPNEVSCIESGPDGAKVSMTFTPATARRAPPAPEGCDPPDDPAPPRGKPGRRPSRCRAELVNHLTENGPMTHAEVIDAMEAAGYSRTTAADALRAVLGVVVVKEAGKYSVPE
jgi:hypothetical protein